MARKILFILFSVICLNAAAQSTSPVLMPQDTNSPVTVTNDSERIINFHADISINNTGLVKVAEHIKVYANGDHIKHGILRVIPLYRKDIYGNNKKIDFEITSITKNGKGEEFRTDNDGEDRKIYVGQGDVTLPEGVYNYVINYQSRGHVGFFDKYDELYWNVTGNNWDFDIENASATISFPNGAVPGNTSCYTGVTGSKNSNCSSSINTNHSVTFIANGPLHPGEGFTVAAAFTAHIIKRPGTLERIYNEYLSMVFGAALLLIFAALYYLLWNKYGRDPVKPVIIPTFQVPNGWSPSMLRYFYKKAVDNKNAAVALINMGVNKQIKIANYKQEEDVYEFTKTSGDRSKLSEEEQSLFNGLFERADTITSSTYNALTFTQARQAFTKRLTAQINLKDYFKQNGMQIFIATSITLIALAVYIIILQQFEALILLMLIPVVALGIYIFRSGLKTLKTNIGSAIFLFIFGALFTIAPASAAFAVITTLPPATAVVVLISAAMYWVFVINISAYTQAGVDIESKIEGFKMYLSTAEEHRLNLLNPPELTPEVFERFLPYAIALDIENAWGAKFENILNQAQYQPDWYNARQPYYYFVSSVPDSFYKSVNISPPSTSDGSGSSSGSSGSSSWSSGSSGGGSSGGGGGGGGGGGW